MALPLALTSFVRSDGRFMGEEGLSTNSTVAVVVGTVLLRCAPLSVGVVLVAFCVLVLCVRDSEEERACTSPSLFPLLFHCSE